ncbi:hypothetical protein FIU74_00700 [Lactobacillus buchneri]|uniref:hypothetical protein n=1 Tax=Lentilactobacillus buchneri TaxID=1581 RepID=UPI001290F30E|nr:hypothetical protein [Lentilactobacillus buchneri]MQM81519.1 hypothetical protein [Lentilactobacillus buchneri]
MAYDLAKVTANGNNLIAQILANKSSLSIDKIEISDTQLSSTTDISTMTSVPKVVQTVSANGFSKNSNTLIISTVVDNSSISADYKAWVFGIWGSDSQNGQSQLIAVITSTNSPDTIPAFSGSTPVSYTYKFNIGFSNASQIQFNMIDDAFATNDTVVHTTGDETIDGQKKFDTDPTDSAGNAYAKTIDVNQQLDKKVNVSDMRKPANDVAGIEEVNAKQDKLTITPADDSKVVHTADMRKPASDVAGLEDITTAYNQGGIADGTDAQSITKEGLYQLNGSHLINFIDSGQWWGTIQVINQGGAILQIARVAQGDIYTNSYAGSPVHWNGWTKLADDSKVAHLSGANNFDTVPTVNNNPLLLASSLPSDLARTGQDQEFTGKNTFDTAPIDKTTGNPYITKDGVPSIPSDVARTGQAQTFTAAQTFSIAPVINDASTDKGDNQAATMADLKSVESSAWHQLDSSKVTGGAIINSLVLYKIDEPNKKIYLSFVILQNGNTPASSDSVYLDFSGVVNKITAASGNVSYDTGGISSITSLSTAVILYPEGQSYVFSGLTGVYNNPNVSNHHSTIPTISYDTLLI